ncbi:MAG: hypothetical protein ABSE00_09470 [Chitinispirillaceae bacterium]|jgi:hypothetical protein
MPRQGFVGAVFFCIAVSFSTNCHAVVRAASVRAANLKAIAALQANVTGGPRGPHPYLLKTVSTQKLVVTGADYQWSINFVPPAQNDTLHIIALRVEFNNGQWDSSTLMAGNGLFGMGNQQNTNDPDELADYLNSDTTYPYDRLQHDSAYFALQLQAIAAYYTKVSRGRLVLQSTVYPTVASRQVLKGGNSETGYHVPKGVLYYSPGGKKNSESWDQYYDRKTQGLMFFIRDALRAAATDSAGSPFAQLHLNAADSTIRDSNNVKVAFLIFHAGASYLTNGGANGTGRDNPADMIDAFVSAPWFQMYADSLGLAQSGVRVKGAGGDSLLISEIMMCSETSNQEGLSWGIQGILVNQIARQLGIPDLFSTSSGESGVGAFCIMDFAGYSAGSGFIPPYPSAWVRAFMGWDNAKAAPLGANSSSSIKAVTTVLDRSAAQAASFSGTDTTILLVPINDHEYYLIENRQRNLPDSTGHVNPGLYLYDTATLGSQNIPVVAAYPFNVNLPANVLLTSGSAASNVILKVRNNDISLPAAGILVWHIDENIIRNRLSQDLVNADSSYRGVDLVQASGVQDIGVAFSNVFYQVVTYNYGGAEDVWPHFDIEAPPAVDISVTGFGPYTQPSTQSNDGGNTYLSLSFPKPASPRDTEVDAIQDFVTVNYCDSVLTAGASWNYLVPGWPKLAAPGGFFDPVAANLDPNANAQQLVLLDSSGKLYAFGTDTTTANDGITYGQTMVAVNRLDVHGDTLRNVDTLFCIDSTAGVFTMPSVVANKVFIPSRSLGIRLLTALSPTSAASWDTVRLAAAPSSYVCSYRSGDSAWAIGCTGGRVVFGSGIDTVRSDSLTSNSPVCAIAAIRENPHTIAVIQTDGTLSLCTDTSSRVSHVKLDTNAIGPFTLVTGDLNRDSSSEIVVCDSRHGLWVYMQKTLQLAPGWTAAPSDWPSKYANIDSATQIALAKGNRAGLPVNNAAPSLADLTQNGYPDIIVGGTNGLYAFNYKGVLVYGWPSYLDNRFWYQRGSITSSPVVVTGSTRKPTVLFSSPTGENATFSVDKIVKANIAKGMIWYQDPSTGGLDSMGELTQSLIDTLLTVGDSLVTPFVTPGGFIDAVDAAGKRPGITVTLPPGTQPPPYASNWPITTGSSPAVAPLAARMTANGPVDLFVPAINGWIYRYRLGSAILPDSLFWPQTGYDNGRSFAFRTGLLPIDTTQTPPITLFSYPNPVQKSLYNQVTFRYQFSGPATNVRLDIVTFSGYSVFSSTSMGTPPSALTGNYPDYNEFQVPISRLGPALYRCRMGATIGGKKYEKFWKLAVTR